MHNTSIWHMLLAEFLGSYILIFAVTAAVSLSIQQGASVVGSALAYGLAFMALIYILGQYSGAHFNPAISFGYAVAGRMNWLLMLGYMVAQFLGGIAAAATVVWLYGGQNNAGASVGTLTYSGPWEALMLEALMTFFLVLVVLMVTRNPMLAVVSGFAIGLTLTFNYLFGGPLTGASMNPARSLGPAIFGNTLSSYWIYIVGPLLGALVAAIVYRLFTMEWGCCLKTDECGKPITDECGNKLYECKRNAVDACGKPIVDCNGKKMKETYLKHEHKLGHWQETPISAIGNWLADNGISPQHVQSQLQHAFPNGHLPHPVEAMGVAAQTVGQTITKTADAVGTLGVGTLETVGVATGITPLSSVGRSSSGMLSASKLPVQPLGSLSPSAQIMSMPQQALSSYTTAALR